MHLTTQSSTQLHSIFGNGFVVEQHGEAAGHYFAAAKEGTPNVEGTVKAIRNAMFDEILKALRSALSVR